MRYLYAHSSTYTAVTMGGYADLRLVLLVTTQMFAENGREWFIRWDDSVRITRICCKTSFHIDPLKRCKGLRPKTIICVVDGYPKRWWGSQKLFPMD